VLEPLKEFWRRLLAWDVLPTPGPEGARRDGAIERPWRYYWDHLPKRTAGADFTAQDYHEARQRAEEVARATLGDELWEELMLDGHLDVPSARYTGITYPLPELEFFAQLYLYARDREDTLVRVAAPQPWDQRLGRTF